MIWPNAQFQINADHDLKWIEESDLSECQCDITIGYFFLLFLKIKIKLFLTSRTAKNSTAKKKCTYVLKISESIELDWCNMKKHCYLKGTIRRMKIQIINWMPMMKNGSIWDSLLCRWSNYWTLIFRPWIIWAERKK